MRRVLGVLAAMTAVAGCASSEPPAATPAPAPGTQQPAATATTTPSTASAATVPTGDVPAALAISAPAVGGGDIDLAAYAGRNLALWFWAPY